MAAPDRFIAWCKQEQASIEQQLELMQSGKVRTGEDIGAGWIDTTHESIERAKARLAELNDLLTEAGKTTGLPITAALIWSPVGGVSAIARKVESHNGCSKLSIKLLIAHARNQFDLGFDCLHRLAIDPVEAFLDCPRFASHSCGH